MSSRNEVLQFYFAGNDARSSVQEGSMTQGLVPFNTNSPTQIEIIEDLL